MAKVFVIAAVLCLAFCEAHRDEITHLPGLSVKPTFKQYSGYLTANDGVHLHYWFVESQSNPSKDPLVLWLNGGPGCSSLDGFLSELGPFHINDDGQTLYTNEFSWNKIANVLFLESPAWVGYSWNEDGSRSIDDDQVADGNYRALLSFFAKFPQFRDNDFYVTGESYGGIYIPTLSAIIVDQGQLNFKGFAIGNGYLDVPKLSNSIVFFAYYHGLVGQRLWNQLVTSCCKNGVGTPDACNFATNLDVKCHGHVAAVEDIINNSGLNVYDLYGNCDNSSAGRKIERDLFDKVSILKPRKRSDNIMDGLPCLNTDHVGNWLNRQDVRHALHIPSHVPKWEVCTGLDYQRVYDTMKPQVLHILGSGDVHGLIYNGDVDMACNFLGDEWFVDGLGLQLVDDYKPWYLDNQVGGFVKVYDKLTFLTIRGSGHMVPQNKPQQAFAMFAKFISNESF